MEPIPREVLDAANSKSRRLRELVRAPEAIGSLFLERFLIVFEAASMLLLVAAVGAVVLAARRRQGAEEAAR